MIITKNFSVEKTAEFWDRQYEQGFIYGFDPSKAAIELVNRIYNSETDTIKKNLKILEIGGGYGRNAKYFVNKLNSFVVIVDISKKAIQLGKSFLKEEKTFVNFINGDVNSLLKYFEIETFDIVFQNFCLHLLDFGDRLTIYKNVHSLLKTNGLFVGSFLSINDSDFNRDVAYNNTIIIRGKKQHFFTKQEIINELNNFFEIVCIEEKVDKETIISTTRNTHFHFVIGVKND